MRVATVCVSPFGSKKPTSASISIGRVIVGRPSSVKVAAPALSVASASLSATILPSGATASLSSSLSSFCCSDFFGSRGGSNEYSSKPSNLGKRAFRSADALSAAATIGPPEK